VTAVRIRRAERGDADFLAGLATDAEVEPFLGTRAARDVEATLAEIDRSSAEPERFGRFLLEVAEEGAWRPAGMIGFDTASPHHRIASLERLAVAPGFRGRGLADDAARLLVELLFGELGFHRVQLECYGFNDRAIRHAERVGFVREGVKRKAYRRHGEWVDGVLFGLVREDLGA